MLQSIRRTITSRLLTAVVVVLVVGGVGSYLLASSNAQSPSTLKKSVSKSLLKPYSLGTAPYQYIAYSGSLDQTRAATGIKQYFAAFVISDGTCTPAWGGSATTNLASPRSVEIAADFAKLRTAGGEVTVSFGGSNGVELASACAGAVELTTAYQSVIDRYGLTRLDFDIEGQTLADNAASARRAAAIVNLERANPGLRVWVTLPVHVKGLTPTGVGILRQLNDHGVTVNGINIMAMNYNIASKDMGKQATTTAQNTFKQLQQIYPNDKPSNIWKAMGITVMVGRNNTIPETFRPSDAPKVRDFALKNGIGLLSIWSAGRDIACPPGTDNTTTAPSISCSGVHQEPYQFLRALSIPAHN